MLANPIRGQIGFVVGGVGYTLSFSINALVALEAEMELPANKIAALLSSPDLSVTQMRTVFEAGLQDHQPEADAALAGHLIGELGINKAAQMIGATFLAAFPSAEEAKGDANPPKGAGTGPSSSGRGAKRASIRKASGEAPRA